MRLRLAIVVLCCASTCVLAQTAYFPKGAFDDSATDQYMGDYYSGHLRNLDEPSLLRLSADAGMESYRFLWLRAFDPPIVIRLDVKADGTGTVTAKIADGQSGFPATCRKVVKNVSRAVTREQVQGFRALMGRMDFWSIATNEDPMDVAEDDGSEWVIEAVKGGKYHVVARWSPDVNQSPGSKAILDLGLAMAMDMARLGIAKDKMY
jgi:hypothetical protein